MFLQDIILHLVILHMTDLQVVSAAIKNPMRSGRWILAVATIPRGHRSCTSLFACAFIRLPQAIRLASATSHHNHHPQQQQQKQQKQQHQGCARLSTKPITQPGVRVMTRAKMLSSVVPQDVEGNVDGECWCGHELFNTVTTEWVQDHLHDPEVSDVMYISRDCHDVPPTE